MKKRNFVLTGIALGLSVFATSLSAQAAIPNEIVEQGSLAPMLEKAQAAVVTLSVEGLMIFQKNLNFSLVINLANNLVEIVVHHATSVV